MARIAQDDLKSSNGIVRGIGVDEKTAVVYLYFGLFRIFISLVLKFNLFFVLIISAWTRQVALDTYSAASMPISIIRHSRLATRKYAKKTRTSTGIRKNKHLRSTVYRVIFTV